MVGENVIPSATDDDAPRDVSRRNLFKQVGLAGAAAAFERIRARRRAVACDRHSAAAGRLETLTAEADILEAIVRADPD